MKMNITTKEKNLVEVIVCHCNRIYAACADGYQDDEWANNKKEYLNEGCTSKLVHSKSFTFTLCETCKNLGFCEAHKYSENPSGDETPYEPYIENTNQLKFDFPKDVNSITSKNEMLNLK